MAKNKQNAMLEAALKYAAMGIKVIPLQAGTKIPATENGVKDATLDTEQIVEWWTENPKYGIALAPDFKVGGLCFLEFDQRPWLAEWAAEEGQPKPRTRLHKSGGKQAPHYLFTHTEKSLELGNTNGVRNGQEHFSFRADRRYVVAPPTIHESGRPYTVAVDDLPAPIPDWLVAKMAREGVSDRQVAGDLRPVSEDMDEEDLFQWFDDAGCKFGTADGDWIPFEICPCAGHRHSGQGVRGCALYWDGGALGFKCWAQNCPSNTDRNEGQSGISYLISFLSKEYQPYDGIIWDEESVVDRAIAAGMRIEESALTPEAGKKAVALAKEQLRQLQDDDGLGIEMRVMGQPKVMAAAAPVAATLDLNQYDDEPAEAAVAVMDPPVQEIKDEPSDPNELKYPRLAFPYDKMPEGSLKALTDKACEGGLDPGLVVPAILTLVSTMIVPDYVEGARINLYCCLLAMVGAGKDTAINRSGTVLNLRSNDAGWHRGLVTKYTPSGERSIAQVIGDTPGGKNKPRIPGPRRHCFVTYEIEETLRKNKGDTSGVFTALQDYFDHNEKLYTDPKKNLTQHVNCRLSWLTALPVGQEEIDPDIFRRAFGESSSHGMQSRMIFGFAEKRFDARRTRNWTVIEEVELDIGTVPKNPYKSVADAISNTVVAEFADGVEDQYLAWQPKQDASGRDTYHILKIAIVIATANGHGRIEQSDWDFAVAWQEWQSEIRRVFSPGRAKKATQAEFNEVIIEEMTKRTRKAMTEEAGYKDKNTQVVNVDGKRVYLRWKGMSNAGRWYKYGMDVEKTIDALVRGGQLEYAMEPKFNDKGNYVKDVANEAWVRLIGIGVKQ